jgi:hypothetical protein
MPQGYGWDGRDRGLGLNIYYDELINDYFNKYLT